MTDWSSTSQDMNNVTSGSCHRTYILAVVQAQYYLCMDSIFTCYLHNLYVDGMVKYERNTEKDMSCLRIVCPLEENLALH